MVKKRNKLQDGEGEKEKPVVRDLDIMIVLAEKGRRIIKASSEDKLRYIVDQANKIVKDESTEFEDHNGKKVKLVRTNPNIICAGRVLDLEKTLGDNKVYNESSLEIVYRFYPVVVSDGEGCIVS
jgi:hypothetical protein